MGPTDVCRYLNTRSRSGAAPYLVAGNLQHRSNIPDAGKLQHDQTHHARIFWSGRCCVAASCPGLLDTVPYISRRLSTSGRGETTPYNITLPSTHAHSFWSGWRCVAALRPVLLGMVLYISPRPNTCVRGETTHHTV